jgi:hypothetical protein
MKVFQLPAAVFAITVLLTACGNRKAEKTVQAADDYVYVALKDFKYQPANISPGTEVEILADMGGRENNADTVFYYQFIVINKQTGDTVRILCPEITVELPGIDKTSTTPTIYNIETRVTTAYYELIDSTKSLLLNVANMDKFVSTNDSAFTAHLLNPANAKEFVLLDKREFTGKEIRFKTAVGTLNFKKRPW